MLMSPQLVSNWPNWECHNYPEGLLPYSSGLHNPTFVAVILGVDDLGLIPTHDVVFSLAAQLIILQNIWQMQNLGSGWVRWHSRVKKAWSKLRTKLISVYHHSDAISSSTPSPPVCPCSGKKHFYWQNRLQVTSSLSVTAAADEQTTCTKVTLRNF